MSRRVLGGGRADDDNLGGRITQSQRRDDRPAQTEDARRDPAQHFFTCRRPVVERRQLEVARLQQRLARLRSGAPPQTVVPWENDADIQTCPLCGATFSLIFRRRHCRLCGRVVCGDCSHGDPLQCSDCELKLDTTPPPEPPEQRAYDILMQYERGIRLLPSDSPRLAQSLTQYEALARKIRDMPGSPLRRRLHQAVHAHAVAFLQSKIKSPKLAILREQHALVSSMMEGRPPDEVASLRANLDDIEREMQLCG